MAMSLKPLGDRVIVQPKAKEEVTKSGIVLPDSASEKPQEGSVLAVGPGKWEDGKTEPMSVAEGQARANNRSWVPVPQPMSAMRPGANWPGTLMKSS